MGSVAATAHGQTLTDPGLAVDLVADGLSTGASLTTAIAFVDETTVLAVDRSDGRIRRVDLQLGVVAGPGPVVFDLDVISTSSQTDNQSEYGVQGLELHPGFAVNGLVYVRYDRSPTPGGDTPQDDVVLGPNFSASIPTLNVIERFVWDAAGNAAEGPLMVDAVIRAVTIDTRYHHGGPIVFHPDGTLSTVYGDLRRTGNGGWMAQTGGALLSVNHPGGVVSDPATIIRINDDGTVPPDNPFVEPGTSAWLAYGVRNSFGLAIDPATGTLWQTDNGPGLFDEINRITPGFNGGWKHLLGPLDHPDQGGSIDSLVVLAGSHYEDPAFSWRDTIGVTGLHFLHGSALGESYDDLLLAGCVNNGHLWAFRLDAARECFSFETPALQDQVDDRTNALEDPPGPDGQEIVWGLGFGDTATGILAIERGADGLPYVLTRQGRLYRIRRAADFDADGVVGIADFLLVLGSWGACPEPCPPCVADIDGDCEVGITEFLTLLGNWG